MSPRNLRISIPLALLAVGGVAILMAQQSGAPAPFTAAQASAGRTTYQERCSSCHNNKRAFGEDFTQCKRCHEQRTFKF